jgi:toxin-antitoxin system PIN domain toxin
VICIDVNLLLYATNPNAAAHTATRVWFEDQMNSGERVGLPWPTLLSFLRLSTQAPFLKPPFTMDTALSFVDEWLEWETVWTPEPTERHSVILAELLRAVPRSAMVRDAHLAALAIEHGLTLCTADAGFRMFPGLKVHNPLQ